MPKEEYVVRRKRADDALRELDELESFTPSFLPSHMLQKKEAEEKLAESEESFYEDNDGWMGYLAGIQTNQSKRGKSIEDIFEDTMNGKKKKKKKKKDGEPKDYSEEFDKELRLLNGLLEDQMRLSDSLQNRYNTLDKQKSSARGVGKFTTDLITTLNSSRALSKDILREITNIRKTIADLNMKEREKLAKQMAGDDGDLNQYASNYLKQIIGVNSGLNGGSGYDIEDVEYGDDAFDDLVLGMESDENYQHRSSEAERFLKYEGRNVTTWVRYNPSTEYKEFVAYDENGDEVDDYPLPSTIDSLYINQSTKSATDSYGQKFPVEFIN